MSSTFGFFSVASLLVGDCSALLFSEGEPAEFIEPVVEEMITHYRRLGSRTRLGVKRQTRSMYLMMSLIVTTSFRPHTFHWQGIRFC